MTLSASKIGTFLQCGRKFRFRYIDRIPAPWKASALALGSAVHGALQTFHEQRITGATMTPDAVSSLFEIDLAAELSETIKYKDDETADDLFASGKSLVKMYAAANQNVAVAGAEVPFEIEVADGIALRGVFDVVLKGDRIRELKTAGRDFSESNLARNVQLSSYSLAWHVLHGRQVTIEVTAMLKQKHARVQSHEVTRTLPQNAWFLQLVIEIADAITSGSFPPNPGWGCDSCEYETICSAAQRGAP